MKAPFFTTEQTIERLEVLWRKLEDEGFYVDANTVALAIIELERLADLPESYRTEAEKR